MSDFLHIFFTISILIVLSATVRSDSCACCQPKCDPKPCPVPTCIDGYTLKMDPTGCKCPKCECIPRQCPRIFCDVDSYLVTPPYGCPYCAPKTTTPCPCSKSTERQCDTKPCPLLKCLPGYTRKTDPTGCKCPKCECIPRLCRQILCGVDSYRVTPSCGCPYCAPKTTTSCPCSTSTKRQCDIKPCPLLKCLAGYTLKTDPTGCKCPICECEPRQCPRIFCGVDSYLETPPCGCPYCVPKTTTPCSCSEPTEPRCDKKPCPMLMCMFGYTLKTDPTGCKCPKCECVPKMCPLVVLNCDEDSYLVTPACGCPYCAPKTTTPCPCSKSTESLCDPKPCPMYKCMDGYTLKIDHTGCKCPTCECVPKMCSLIALNCDEDSYLVTPPCGCPYCAHKTTTPYPCSKSTESQCDPKPCPMYKCMDGYSLKIDHTGCKCPTCECLPKPCSRIALDCGDDSHLVTPPCGCPYCAPKTTTPCSCLKPTTPQ